MTTKSKPAIALSRTAWDDLKRLPGNLRRQMITAIDELEKKPHPANSRRLALAEEQREARRLRLGYWRVIYLMIDERPLVLAIRRRPPYDYSDLESLIKQAE